MSKHKNNKDISSKTIKPANENNKQQIASLHAQQVRTIFDPEIVKKYSEMVPDAPQRILIIFEKNSDTERKVKTQQFSENRRRDWMGYSLTLLLLIATAYFSYMDKPFIYYPTLIGFLAVFIKNLFRNKER